MKCSCCGNTNPSGMYGVVYSHTLWIDSICWDCFDWMVELLSDYEALQYTPHSLGNPNIVNVDDISPHHIKNGTRPKPVQVSYPIFMP